MPEPVDKKTPFYPHEKGQFVLEPKVIEGFLVDFARVKVEGSEKNPAQNLARLRHLKTGADCYIATGMEEKETDQELVELAKGILSRLVTESRQFAQLNASDQLGEIHKVIGKYMSALDVETLGALRQEFKQAAQQFPSVPENLNQIDLAATWDWQIQQSLRKPVEMIVDFKPIEGIDLKTELRPVVLSPSPRT